MGENNITDTGLTPVDSFEDMPVMLQREEHSMSSCAESVDEEGNFLMNSMNNKVTATLVTAGPAGVSAAAAILSARNKKRPHTFETNPSIRKRHTTRLLRKLKHTLEEFAARVGQQAIVLVVNPVEMKHNFKVFGTKPLLDILRSLQPTIVEDLKTSLTKRMPPQVEDDPLVYPLPPLDIDCIPTPVEKMTQAQLRAFIPHMLKYSTLRGKPGWGRENTKPPWWPVNLPWANVRMDVRSETEKQKVSWTHALRQVVTNCYKYHGREDLLPVYSEDVLIPDIKSESNNVDPVTEPVMSLHTVANTDGTVSLVQIDPNNPVITLPDGSTARVEMVDNIPDGDVQTTSSDDGNDQKCSTILGDTFNTGGQIILTVSNEQMKEMLALPGVEKGSSFLQLLTTSSDGTMSLTPFKINKSIDDDKDTNDIESDTADTLIIEDHQPTKVYQMLSMTSETVTVSHTNIKLEEH